MGALLVVNDTRGIDAAERGPQPGPGPAHPGPDGSLGNAQCLGDLVIGQLGPGDEQHDVTLAGIERGDRRGHRAAGGVRGEPGIGPVGEGFGRRVDTVRARARNWRASSRCCLRIRSPAIPYSHGRASSLVTS